MSCGIVEVISEMEDLLSGKGVSEEAVAQAEESLGVQFSDDFRDYLLAFGIAAMNGHELTGLGSSPRVDVVKVTEEKRAGFDQPLEGFYVIEDENMDGIVYWQNDSGCVFRTVNQTEPKIIADSLQEYISM